MTWIIAASYLWRGSITGIPSVGDHHLLHHTRGVGHQDHKPPTGGPDRQRQGGILRTGDQRHQQDPSPHMATIVPARGR